MSPRSWHLALDDGICMFKNQGHRRSVLQYHVENEKPLGKIIVLGLHEPAKDNFESRNATFLALRPVVHQWQQVRPDQPAEED